MTQAPTMPGDAFDDGRPQKNTIGLVGFILSLLALVTCGALSIISLLVSIVGAFKAPRGLAIAGVIISIIGTAFFAMVGAGLISLWVFGGAVWQQGMGAGLTTVEVQNFYQQNGRMPDAAEAASIMANIDFGGVTPTYQVTGPNSAELTLPGFDGQLGTQDDMPFPINVPPSATTPPPAPTAPTTPAPAP
ncbi:MAG: hypothetical protein AAGI37_21330 [Planctomycetota bacterium]